MGRNIAIIKSHPDPSRLRFGRALEAAYAQGAGECGHEIRTLDVATLDFPLLRTKSDWETGTAPETIRHAQDGIRWADHLVIFYLLWAGSMPAPLKGFIEQTFRPSFAMDPRAGPKGRKRGVHRGRFPPAGSAGGLVGGGAAASRGATSQSRSSGNCASRSRAKSTSPGRRDRRTASRKAFAKRRV